MRFLSDEPILKVLSEEPVAARVGRGCGWISGE